MSQIQITDQFGNGLGGIPIRFALEHNTSESAPFDMKTNDDGTQNWPIWQWSGDQGYTLYVNTGDYRNPDYTSDAKYVAPHDGGDQPFTLTRVAHESGFLHIDGRHFKTEDGKPWLLAGYASYTIISEIAKGHDIGPFLDEAISYGANTLVCLGMDLGPYAHAHDFAVDPRDPNWPTWLAILFDACAERHLRCAFGVFQQAQPLSDSEKADTWRKACDVARGRWNVLLRLGNEDDVNGWNHGMFPRPENMGGVLVSTGSRGINNPPTPPNWDFAEWEPPREPRAKTFSDAGGAGWYMMDGYPDFPAVTCPLVCIEPPFFNNVSPDAVGDTRWTSVDDALTLGLNIGANFAGGVFGSSDSLETRLNNATVANQARAFFRGLWAAFVR